MYVYIYKDLNSSTRCFRRIHRRTTNLSRSLISTKVSSSPSYFSLPAVLGSDTLVLQPKYDFFAYTPAVLISLLPNFRVLFPPPCRLEISVFFSSSGSLFTRHEHGYREKTSKNPKCRPKRKSLKTSYGFLLSLQVVVVVAAVVAIAVVWIRIHGRRRRFFLGRFQSVDWCQFEYLRVAYN